MGIVANQPLVRAGALDPDSLAKEHDFVDLCDTFGLPLVFLHDVPGLMIGSQAERSGILHAYERTVSRIAGRRCRGSGWCCARPTAAGTSPWAGARPGPTSSSPGPRRRWASWRPRPASAPCTAARLDRLLADEGPDARDARAAELTAEWVAESEPWEAAAHLSLDDVIAPAATRHVIATSIEIAWGERPHRVGHRGGRS